MKALIVSWQKGGQEKSEVCRSRKEFNRLIRGLKREGTRFTKRAAGNGRNTKNRSRVFRNHNNHQQPNQRTLAHR